MAALLWLAILGASVTGARGDELLHRVELDDGEGYIMTAEYAEAHKAELLETIPGSLPIEGFWTPGDTTIYVAARVFRETIEAAAKDPTALFPNLAPRELDPTEATSATTIAEARAVAAKNAAELESERKEIEKVSANLGRYARQYVGIIVKGEKLVFCNYSIVAKLDASSEYIFTDKAFEADGKVHFVQCRFDPEAKTCANVSMIGLWVPGAKTED